MSACANCHAPTAVGVTKCTYCGTALASDAVAKASSAIELFAKAASVIETEGRAEVEGVKHWTGNEQAVSDFLNLAEAEAMIRLTLDRARLEGYDKQKLTELSGRAEELFATAKIHRVAKASLAVASLEKTRWARISLLLLLPAAWLWAGVILGVMGWIGGGVVALFGLIGIMAAFESRGMPAHMKAYAEIFRAASAESKKVVLVRSVTSWLVWIALMSGAAVVGWGLPALQRSSTTEHDEIAETTTAVAVPELPRIASPAIAAAAPPPVARAAKHAGPVPEGARRAIANAQGILTMAIEEGSCGAASVTRQLKDDSGQGWIVLEPDATNAAKGTYRTLREFRISMGVMFTDDDRGAYFYRDFGGTEASLVFIPEQLSAEMSVRVRFSDDKLLIPKFGDCGSKFVVRMARLQ